MSTAMILIDMATHKIVGTFPDEDAADVERERLGPPKHCVPVGGTWEGLNASDLAKIFNQLPGVKPVKRFSDRDSAVRRVNAALANPGTEQPHEPGDEPSPIVEPQPTEKIWDAPEQEQKMKTKTKAKKKASNGGTRTPRADTPTTVAMTATGKKDGIKFNKDSPRSKVFAKIKEAEQILVSELAKKCAAFVNRSQLMGCLQKLKAKSYIKVS